MRLFDLTAYLDAYLEIAQTPDYRDAWNGLQVQGNREIRKIAVAVDACRVTILHALEQKADLMIVHHGLFWGVKPPLTGNFYERTAPLIREGVALYSAHLPLDVHPEVGNNHVLARALGLPVSGTFGKFEGLSVGLLSDTELSRRELTRRIKTTLGVSPLGIETGPETLKRVALLTGGGGSLLLEAVKAGADAFVTGEGNHHSYFEAEENGINVFFAGHYATETVGVKALAAHLAERFGVETVFLDHPTGL